MAEEKKSYYAIIPANVRYDETLPPNAKLLYGEITALCNAEGYCWASNKYFADLYGVADRTIRRWLRSLNERGYIESKVFYKKGSKEIERRFITIAHQPMDENVLTLRTEMSPPTDKNVLTPSDKNVLDNNTSSFNTTSNNTNEYIDKPPRKRFTPPSREEVQAYCVERNNNVDAERFIDYYTSNGWMVGKNHMKDWKSAVRTWEKNGYSNKSNQNQQQGSGNMFIDMLNERRADK